MSETVDALLAAVKKCAEVAGEQARGASAGSSQGYAMAARDLAAAADLVMQVEQRGT